MPITIPVRATTLKEALAYLKNLKPLLSTSLDQIVGGIVETVVELVQGIYKQVRATESNIWPSASQSDAVIERHAERALGSNPRRGATKSTGVDAIRVTGTLAGAAIAAGATMVHADGTRYVLTEGATIGSGTADLSVEAIDTGAATNKLTGDTMQLEGPPVNITQQVDVVVDLTGGLDRETNGQLLARVFNAIRNPPAGGRAADYFGWAMEVDGVANAYVYVPSSVALDGRRGIGIVDVAILGTGSGAARIPSAALLLAAQDKIDSERPAMAKESIVIAPDSDPEDVDVTIVPTPDFDFDWTEDAARTVSSFAAPVITWSGDLSASLRAKVDATGQARIYVAGQVLTVIAYDNSGPFTTTVDETPSPDPASPDPIYPAGPLSQAAKDAIVAYFDRLGPARGVSPDEAADPEQDDWDDTLKPSKIYATLVRRTFEDGTTSGILGLDDATVVTPAANVVPVDHASTSGTVDLITPNEITIRPE